jgi:hypothetical protein
MEDYEKTRAIIKPFADLAEGEKLIGTKGLFPIAGIGN